jgi:NAD-dependent deacetylase
MGDADIERVVERMKRGGRRNAAVTGAGISVESGVAPFRGKGGMWEKVDPMKIAHIDAFMRDPVPYWQMRGPFIESLGAIEPNPGHLALAGMQRIGMLGPIVTQNIDGLHQRAGSDDVLEFHGNVASLRCLECGATIPSMQAPLEDRPPRCVCGGVLRPEVVFFGEAIPPEVLVRSQQVAEQCEVMLVVGTSGVVQPAASIPLIAKHHGALVVEVNPERTPLTDAISDVFIEGKGGDVLPRVLELLEK